MDVLLVSCIIIGAPDLSPSVAVTFFCFLTMQTKSEIYLALKVKVYFLQGRIIKRAFGKLKLEHVYLGRDSFSRMLPT